MEILNGLEAWNELQNDTMPKLIILDLMITEINEFKLLQRVRVLLLPQPHYVTMHTTKDRKPDMVNVLNTGVNDYRLCSARMI